MFLPLFLYSTGRFCSLVAVHQVADLANINVDRALTDAAAASDTEDLIEVLNRVGEFVHDALTHTFFLAGARVMPRSVVCEERELT